MGKLRESCCGTILVYKTTVQGGLVLNMSVVCTSEKENLALNTA